MLAHTCPQYPIAQHLDHADERADAELVSDIRALVADRPTYGYRRVHAVLRRQAERLGAKRPIQNASTAS